MIGITSHWMIGWKPAGLDGYGMNAVRCYVLTYSSEMEQGEEVNMKMSSVGESRMTLEREHDAPCGSGTHGVDEVLSARVVRGTHEVTRRQETWCSPREAQGWRIARMKEWMIERITTAYIYVYTQKLVADERIMWNVWTSWEWLNNKTRIKRAFMTHDERLLKWLSGVIDNYRALYKCEL
jgi:hypothetical protein